MGPEKEPHKGATSNALPVAPRSTHQTHRTHTGSHVRSVLSSTAAVAVPRETQRKTLSCSRHSPCCVPCSERSTVSARLAATKPRSYDAASRFADRAHCISPVSQFTYPFAHRARLTRTCVFIRCLINGNGPRWTQLPEGRSRLSWPSLVAWQPTLASNIKRHWSSSRRARVYPIIRRRSGPLLAGQGSPSRAPTFSFAREKSPALDRRAESGNSPLAQSNNALTVFVLCFHVTR